jgi:hypothetical protein
VTDVATGPTVGGDGGGEEGDPAVAPAVGVECDAATVPLTTGDRIRNLLGRYCDLMDAGDFDAVGELFGDGVLADERGRPLASGSAAIAAFYAAGTRLHAPSGTPRTKHLLLNTVLSEADGGGVVARSSYLVLQAVDGELALQPIITGRYLDTFSATDAWIERRFLVDLVGDLSHHLGFDLPS